MRRSPRPVPWLTAGEAFPPIHTAWGAGEPAPGLLAAGGVLDTPSLLRAYQHGIFPWFSLGQPILWWSPDPRMVLKTDRLRLHRSLKKTIKRFLITPGCELKFDSAFSSVIEACASVPRDGQPGTWIVPEMIAAYSELHRAGHAHSVEVWMDSKLAGGLYCVNLGRMVFGESMFARRTDASKIALAALVAFCRSQGIGMIDCQQNTSHLASLGAAEIARVDFAAQLHDNAQWPAPRWTFDPACWQHILQNSD